MKKLLIITLLFIQKGVFAQNAQEIKVRTLQSPIITYSTFEELISPKVLNSAIELSLKVKLSKAQIYGSINYLENTGIGLTGKLHIKYNNTNSTSANINYNEIPLSETPALLFSQPAFGNGVDHYKFYYDLIIAPLTEFVAPQNNFTITFTLTNQ